MARAAEYRDDRDQRSVIVITSFANGPERTSMTDDTEQIADRAKHLQAILDSASPKKLIVAGPGTGKSFTFKQLLQHIGGNGLALTFINLLASDLESALAGLADAGTLHGFCRGQLHRHSGPGITSEFHYYPELVFLQAEDLRLVDGLDVDREVVEGCFHALKVGDGIIEASLRSGEVYNAVGHCDSVYRVLRQLEAGAISDLKYAQVVVDEFQDFSPLEVAFILAIGNQSPLLLVGDDDQALYGFKGASPKFLRELWVDEGWEQFELPYCSRCTSVLVAAVHDVVTRAQNAGLLPNRISKAYECFLPEKRADSEKYPTITYAQCSVDRKSAAYRAKYIARAIAEIPDEDIRESREKGEPTALVIGPSHLLGPVASVLGETYSDITYRPSAQAKPRPIDAVRFLLNDAKCQLAWRILLHTERPPAFEEFIGAALVKASNLCDSVAPEFRERWLTIIELIRRAAREELAKEEQLNVEGALSMSLPEVMQALGLIEPTAAERAHGSEQAAITLTTLTGAKGLQARHVFVLGLNDGQFPRDNSCVTEGEVCQLLVALTRAKCQCTLISTDNYAGNFQKESVFLGWISSRLSHVRVDKTYFAS